MATLHQSQLQSPHVQLQIVFRCLQDGVSFNSAIGGLKRHWPFALQLLASEIVHWSPRVGFSGCPHVVLWRSLESFQWLSSKPLKIAWCWWEITGDGRAQVSRSIFQKLYRQHHIQCLGLRSLWRGRSASWRALVTLASGSQYISISFNITYYYYHIITLGSCPYLQQRCATKSRQDFTMLYDAWFQCIHIRSYTFAHYCSIFFYNAGFTSCFLRPASQVWTGATGCTFWL